MTMATPTTTTPNMGSTAALLPILRPLHEASLPEPGHLKEYLYGVEVGVHRGATSAMLLREFHNLHLTLIDEWTTYPPEHPYRQSGDGCAKFTEAEQRANMLAAIEAVRFASNRAYVIRGNSEYAIEERYNGREREVLASAHPHFVFVDGNHTYEAVADDIRRWWPLIRPGGIIAGHDWGHPRDQRGVWGVTKAVVEFVGREGLMAAAVGEVWWVKKPSEPANESGGKV